ncbi:YgiT-type zinc finger protein [Gloeobacter morelensis]|uniref:YgiT-type zinc finger protein n=1 Tax=Gloeobacter morelensis MG652769 TaxID=2781736 RepID=A0ABY3PIT1_9CYAN|nr:YgiT-type zinc finger protein [Gloeobacter morelensis]UFP93581.1 YgiT-type zinc finger protein [Gloeobacter morelensis MG652769]
MNDCCYHCGGKHIEKRKVEYLYSLQGKHLLVPDMPAELCLDCGTLYYPGWALEEVERRFFAIESNAFEPDRIVCIPETRLGAA